MSGHSKWHSIKHQKAAEDKKKGKLFSKLVREITVAARMGGGKIEMNPRLRLAVEKANSANMPKDNIERAIKKGTGELPGTSYVDAVYEGYGPLGVAVMVKVTTDNRNRTVSQIRRIFSDNGGSLGENGCVNWMFKQKGFIAVSKASISEEELLEKVIDLDVENIDSSDEDIFEVLTSPENFSSVRDQLEKRIKVEAAELTMIPDTYIKLTGSDAAKMLKLMDELEENDDVHQVYANFDISAAEMREN